MEIYQLPQYYNINNKKLLTNEIINKMYNNIKDPIRLFNIFLNFRLQFIIQDCHYITTSINFIMNYINENKIIKYDFRDMFHIEIIIVLNDIEQLIKKLDNILLIEYRNIQRFIRTTLVMNDSLQNNINIINSSYKIIHSIYDVIYNKIYESLI